MKKAVISVLLFIAFLVGSVSGVVFRNPLLGIPDAPRPTGIFETSIPTDREMEKELIRMDIEDAGNRIGLSTRQQTDYIKYVEAAANKYKLPMILIHTIAYVESGYDPSAVHPNITVKGKSTRALGLMGIVWEYNDSSLIKEKIATSRLELTEPGTNIMSGTFHLHNDATEILTKNPKITEDKFFDELIRKYYGAYDESYKVRMLAKIKDMASRQWIRRTVKSIFVMYKTQIKPTVVLNSTESQ